MMEKQNTSLLKKIGLVLFTPTQIIFYKNGKLDIFNQEEIDLEELEKAIERVSNGIIATGHFLQVPLNGKQVLEEFFKALKKFDQFSFEIEIPENNIIDIQGLIGYIRENKEAEKLVEEVMAIISDNLHLLKKMSKGQVGQVLKRIKRTENERKIINVFKDF